MKKSLLTVLVAFFFIACSSTAQQINNDDDWNIKGLDLLQEKSFNVNENGKLVVDVIGSDVEVNGWNENETHVKVYGKKNEVKKYKLFIEKEGDVVKIKMKKKGNFFSNLFRRFKGLHFRVFVPNKYIVDCTTSGGDVFVGNVDGKFNISTSGGDIDIKNCNGVKDVTTSGGDIKLENSNEDAICSTSGGDIKLVNVIGNVDLSTSGGDIKAIDIEGKIDASTSGGDISVRYKGEIKGVIDLSTTGGDINLDVPQDFKCKLVCDTSGGSVDVNHDFAYGKVRRSSFEGTINKGTILINLDTTGGDITVNKR